MVIVRILCVISSLSLIRTGASANVLCARGACCKATPRLPSLIFWEKIILKDIKENKDIKESGGSLFKMLGMSPVLLALLGGWRSACQGCSSPCALDVAFSHFVQHLGIFFTMLFSPFRLHHLHCEHPGRLGEIVEAVEVKSSPDHDWMKS